MIFICRHHGFSASIYRCSPETSKWEALTSKWEGLMPQVGWDSSKREGWFRVGFGVGHINKAQPIWSWPAHLELALTSVYTYLLLQRATSSAFAVVLRVTPATCPWTLQTSGPHVYCTSAWKTTQKYKWKLMHSLWRRGYGVGLTQKFKSALSQTTEFSKCPNHSHLMINFSPIHDFSKV